MDPVAEQAAAEIRAICAEQFQLGVRAGVRACVEALKAAGPQYADLARVLAQIPDAAEQRRRERGSP